ncbi:MAG: 4-hydroxy-3-methylbut-2-enyl diphosphate reductase [Thermodesulfovibrionales bacterium]|nr:4-hydroxy-3-methylbut-2-enyl diphosphate reductase [Thermodesulfovibrionales bacterium]
MFGDVEIIVAKRAGFCFGVKRAVDIAFEYSKRENNVFTYGPIIHNPQVVEKLKKVGVEPFDYNKNGSGGCKGTIIIRTHGVPLITIDRLQKEGYKIVDATCPFVKKAQEYAKLLSDKGYQVVIVGDAHHPEVEGLVSYAGDDCIVTNSADGINRLRSKVGVVVQTTQTETLLKEIVGRLLDKVKELKVFNTICNSTKLRLKETRSLAKKVDCMFVVGGKNSANTTQLARLCMSQGIPTYHIETAAEVLNVWLDGVKKIGITAGASTPDWIINELVERIKDIQEDKGRLWKTN